MSIRSAIARRIIHLDAASPNRRDDSSRSVRLCDRFLHALRQFGPNCEALCPSQGPCRYSPVYDHVVPVDEAGGIASKEHCGGGNVVRFSSPWKRLEGSEDIPHGTNSPDNTCAMSCRRWCMKAMTRSLEHFQND
jgi:hypothetical protein